MTDVGYVHVDNVFLILDGLINVGLILAHNPEIVVCILFLGEG